MSVLQNLVYPAAITASGIAGNAFILGGQIKGIREDVTDQLKEVKEDIKEQVKDVKDDIRELLHRQTELEIHDMARIQQLVMDCDEKRG